MNRNEFAALIAANPPVPASSSPNMFQEDRQKSSYASSPVSPRQQFQSRVRNLQQQRSPSSRRPTLRRRRHSELEQVSSLRVANKRSHSTQPSSQDTPDFSIEERKAWGSASPEIGRTSTDSHLLFLPQPQPQLTPVLPPPYTQTHSLLQPRKQERPRVPLRTFAPLNTIIDVDERPKTSRGDRALGAPAENEEPDENNKRKDEQEDTDDSPKPSASVNHNGRSSKFVEGSMTQRSFGIASSWFRDGRTEDNKPLPLTPPTKHVTFSCTPVTMSLDEPTTEQETPTTKKRERKGIRKSISNFNFQTLSERMRIFGGSSNDGGPEANEKKRLLHKHASVSELTDDRKRKAEEAYAAQFGFKKQKVSTPAIMTAVPPQIDGQREHAGTTNQDSYSSHSSRRSAVKSLKGPGLRRKKSRRELEQENAELRARLAQQDHQPSTPIEASVRSTAVTLPAGTGRGKLRGDVPPVPQGPGRGGLKVLENGKRNSRASTAELKGKIGKEDDEKQVGRPKQQWEWPEDVF